MWTRQNKSTKWIDLLLLKNIRPQTEPQSAQPPETLLKPFKMATFRFIFLMNIKCLAPWMSSLGRWKRFRWDLIILEDLFLCDIDLHDIQALNKA